MEDLSGKVVVITGGASGIGLALANRFVAEGARIVLADIERPALGAAADTLRGQGAEVLGVVCDVGEAGDVEALARAAIERFGAVHVVCNNAGVGGGGFVESIPLTQWQWLVRVNLWGVIHGVHTFLPLLLAQNEGHIVNTASILGLVAGPLSAPYSVTKFGVVALSESLKQELTLKGSEVGVSVVCPGWVATNIHDSERNRPADLSPGEPDDPDGAAAGKEMFKGVIDAGMSPEVVADLTVEAVKADRFYVLPSAENTELVRARMDAILAGDPPPFAMPR